LRAKAFTGAANESLTSRDVESDFEEQRGQLCESEHISFSTLNIGTPRLSLIRNTSF